MRAEESYDLGPYPRTKEDYLKAARKYNMIPEDYKPLPEEEGLGDYPDIMAFGGFRRDKNEDFTDRMFDRSYGEILHRDADLYDWERIDPQHEEYQYFSLPVRCLIFFGFWATFPILHFTCEYFDLHVNHNRKQEQHPKDGPHYSFELVDSEWKGNVKISVIDVIISL